VLIEEQDNWNLIRNPSKGKYCVLISVNKWSIELQDHEFISLVKCLNELIDQFLTLENQMMDEELINLEFERLPWYAELEGTKNNWSLRIIFESIEQTRSFEMYWPSSITKNLCFEMRKMWESMH
tara:strand:+ start:158 stop:532 length:375 start_codon:yes stop_codon:yes gene_type:complete